MHIHIHIYIYICIQTIYIYSNGTNNYNSCTQGARQPVALWHSRMAFRSLCWSLWRWIMAPLLVEHVIIKYVINIVLVFYNHHIYNHHIGYWCSHLVFLGFLCAKWHMLHTPRSLGTNPNNGMIDDRNNQPRVNPWWIHADWWFGAWLDYFFHILEMVIPTDFHIFQRG